MTEQQEKSFPEIIREFRKQKRWSQAQLAVKLMVSDNAIYMWEAGRTKPAGKSIRKLIDLGVPMPEKEIKKMNRSEALKQAFKEANPEKEKRSYTMRLPELDRVQIKIISDELEKFLVLAKELPYLEFLEQKETFIRSLVRIVKDTCKNI